MRNVEHDRDFDHRGHLDPDGHREEEDAVFDDQKSHHVREDARAHDDEDQPAQQGVERHAEEDQIDRLLGDAVGDRDARHERREPTAPAS